MNRFFHAFHQCRLIFVFLVAKLAHLSLLTEERRGVIVMPSPLMQGRGLKLLKEIRKEAVEASPLMQGRGLKHELLNINPNGWSRPSCRGVD